MKSIGGGWRPYYRLERDNPVLDGSFSRNLRFRRFTNIWTNLIDPTIDRYRLIQWLTRIPRIDRKLTHLGRQFRYKNQYIAVMLGLGRGLPYG